MDSVQSGIKSKERVQKHGEVFTPDSIVNDMLDLTEKDFDMSDIKGYISRTYLEPSCGNGNFLLRILDRKLAAVQKLPKEEHSLQIVKAFASIYGVDIQADNVTESRDRMWKLFSTGEMSVLELPKKEVKPWSFVKFDEETVKSVEHTVKFILDSNIVHGNFLTGKGGPGCEDANCVKDLHIIEYVWDGDTVTMYDRVFSGLLDDATRGDMVKRRYDAIRAAEKVASGTRKNRADRDKKAKRNDRIEC